MNAELGKQTSLSEFTPITRGCLQWLRGNPKFTFLNNLMSPYDGELLLRVGHRVG